MSSKRLSSLFVFTLDKYIPRWGQLNYIVVLANNSIAQSYSLNSSYSIVLVIESR